MEFRGRYFARLSLLSLIVSASSLLVLGQNPTEKPRPIADIPATFSPLRPVADETFELNIAERRFTKENFEASTDVATDSGGRGVTVRVGVSLTAGKIEVLLRNVHGNVRFRGTLDRILEVIGKRPASPAEVR